MSDKSTNYYTTIDGLNYDKKVLELAEELIKKKGDGILSIKDTDLLIEKIFDKKIITNTEYRTIFYVLSKYKFTKQGKENFLDKLIKFNN